MILDKTCAFCFTPFKTYRDSIKYCSMPCSGKAVAAKNPQSQPQFNYTVEMFLEAEEKTPLGANRAKYISDTFGGTTSMVAKGRRRLNYIWKRRPRPAFDRKCAWFFRKFVKAIGCCLCDEKRLTEAAHEIALCEKGEDSINNIIPFFHRLSMVQFGEKLIQKLSNQYPEIRQYIESSGLKKQTNQFEKLKSDSIGDTNSYSSNYNSASNKKQYIDVKKKK